jgi:hypothetical protein
MKTYRGGCLEYLAEFKYLLPTVIQNYNHEKEASSYYFFLPFRPVFRFFPSQMCIQSFIHQWLYSPLLGPGLFISFIIFFTQTVGLLRRVMNPLQGRHLHTGQHKHRINAHTDIHALNGIRTHDLSARVSEDNSCLRPRGHRDRPLMCIQKLVVCSYMPKL